MKTSQTGINLIKQFEGLNLRAYLCPAKVWTIGYGSTRIGNRMVNSNDVITAASAELLLVNDLITFETGLLRLLTVKLTQNQFDALVSFVYNVGLGSFRNSTLRRLINSNPNDINIRAQFLRWNRAGGKVLNGLVRRREAEAALYFKK